MYNNLSNVALKIPISFDIWIELTYDHNRKMIVTITKIHQII